MDVLQVGDYIRIVKKPFSCCGCLMLYHQDQIKDVLDYQGRTYYLLQSGQFVWASDVIKDILNV